MRTGETLTRATLALVVSLVGCGGEPARRPSDPKLAEPHGNRLDAAYDAPVGRIIAASDEAEFAWAWLRTLCVDIGHRIAGSPSLARAIDWSATELEGIEGVRVWRQPVEVPVWIRGEESLTLLGEPEEPLAMIGLGGSVGTPTEGIEGEVVVVGSLDEVDARAAELVCATHDPRLADDPRVDRVVNMVDGALRDGPTVTQHQEEE